MVMLTARVVESTHVRPELDLGESISPSDGVSVVSCVEQNHSDLARRSAICVRRIDALLPPPSACSGLRKEVE